MCTIKCRFIEQMLIIWWLIQTIESIILVFQSINLFNALMITSTCILEKFAFEHNLIFHWTKILTNGMWLFRSNGKIKVDWLNDKNLVILLTFRLNQFRATLKLWVNQMYQKIWSQVFLGTIVKNVKGKIYF